MMENNKVRSCYIYIYIYLFISESETLSAKDLEGQNWYILPAFCNLKE